VTGVTNSGAFIELDKYLADGMIKTADLPVGHGNTGGRWSIDPRSGALVHQGTGRSFAIGDRVSVTIAAIDLALRRMDLAIADPKARDAGKPKKIGAAAGGVGGPGGGAGGGHLN